MRASLTSSGLSCARALCALCALALSGCQGQPLPEGAFVVLLDAPAKGLDPRFAVGDSSAKLIGLIHAGLISTDTPDGVPALELAESITQPIPTRYEITLKPGLTFHDGSPLTTADVEYTLMSPGQLKGALAGITQRIHTLTLHDERRMTLELKEPSASFMWDLAIGVVSKRACQGLEQCPEPVLGAGPFRLKEQRGEHTFILEAFEGYVQGQPALKDVVLQVVKDDNTRLLALLGGSASLVQNAVTPLMLPVIQEQPRHQVQTSTSAKYTYLAFNLRDERLRDLRVRQALAHGLDRQAIITSQYRGLARLSTGLLSPAHWAYEPDVATFPYDPERAMRLLDEAGFPDPDGPHGPLPRLELELKVSANKFRRALALLMAHQWAKIGVRVRVRAYEWGTYFADIKSGNFQLTTMQWPSVLDPGLYRWIFHTENIPSAQHRSAGANRGAYSNPDLDVLLDQAQRETDGERARALYSQIQKIVAADLPYVSLWHEDNIAIVKAGYTGYQSTPNARFEALKHTRPAAP